MSRRGEGQKIDLSYATAFDVGVVVIAIQGLVKTLLSYTQSLFFSSSADV